MTVPRITFNISAPPPGTAGGTSTFLDINIFQSSANYPGLGTIGSWCLDQRAAISAATYVADVYSSTELAVLGAAMPTLGYSGPVSNPGLTTLDNINWLLNNPNTVLGTGWREFQAAIWTLMGNDPQASGNIAGYNTTTVNQIVANALATDALNGGTGFRPGLGQAIGAVLDTQDGNGAHFQPLLIQTVAAGLGDRVWNDVNGNGIQDSGESGIGGATVNLVRDLNNDNIIQAGEVLRTTTTLANGYYEFVGLLPGLDYQVQFVTPAGYSLASPSLVGGDPALDSNGPLSGVVNLNPGQFNDTIDAGFYNPVIVPARISGYVYEDLDNDGQRLTGPNGTFPIGGVLITLTGTDTGGNAVNLTTTTSATGFYEFANLNPGTYTVTETQPGAYLDGKDTAGSLGGNTSVNDTISGIGLTSGANSTENNFGELVGAQINGYVYVDLDNNGIKAGTEATITGVTLTLTGTNDLGQPVTATTTTTNGAGYYEFVGLRPGNYTVTEGQPAGYLDGKDTPGLPGGGNASTNDVIAQITLTPGLISSNNNFGELLPASLAGFVYVDANNDGIKGGTEAAIGGVTVKLTGTSDLGAVTLTTTTAANGSYSFINLRPGTYTVNETQPVAFLDGKDTAGSLGGTVTNDQIAAVTLKAGDASVNNNFGELQVSNLSGFVYYDVNNNGIKEAGEAAISGTTVKLTGLNDLGASVSLTTTTNASGYYEFTNLRPSGVSGYTLTETQPAGYNDGKDAVGSQGGTLGNDVFSSITLPAGVNGTNNNYGEILAPVLGSIGDRVWVDANYNGIQDSGEAGLAGVTVKLLTAGADGNFGTADDVTLATTATNGSGNYLFTGLAAGQYDVMFVKPTGYFFTQYHTGANTGVDSDANTTTGLSQVVTLASGQSDLTIDAGIYRKAAVGDKVFEDENENGVQDKNYQGLPELGIANITVKLYNATTNALLGTQKTDANGNYLFTNLDPGSYYLTFDKSSVSYIGSNLNGWKWSPKQVTGVIGNDGLLVTTATDSNPNGDGISKVNLTKTDNFTLVSGQTDLTRDAGITPLVINLDGHGLQTVSRHDSAGTFDLFGNGGPVASGWITSGSAFLAVDKNHNGKIDDISELFGGTEKGAGYAGLGTYDSNHDGVVDARDAAFGDLVIWQDLNGNHQTDAGELMTLAQAGIASLSLAHDAQAFIDSHGNVQGESSAVTMADGRTVTMTDVYFGVSASDALAAGVKLPTLAELVGSETLDATLGSNVPAAAKVAVDGCESASAADIHEALRNLMAFREGHALAAA